MTNGVVSIVVDGKVVMKLVTGHDGMFAPKVADDIRKLGRVPTVEEARAIALTHSFGCRECIVVGTPDDPFNNEDMRVDREYGPRYYETFSDPRANPRWEHEAEYTEVIEL